MAQGITFKYLRAPWCKPAPSEAIPAAFQPRAPDPESPRARGGRAFAPRRVYIRQEDLDVHGYTTNCRRCALTHEVWPPGGSLTAASAENGWRMPCALPATPVWRRRPTACWLGRHHGL